MLKFLLTAILIGLAIFFFWYHRPRGQRRRSKVEEAARRATQARLKKTETMQECPICGAFAVEPCNREGCPMLPPPRA